MGIFVSVMKGLKGNSKLYIFAGLGIVALIGWLLFSRTSSPSASGQSSGSSESKARSSQEINRDFEYEITKAVGKEPEKKLKMTIEKAELVDEIVVKGQKATAVPGRTFLILSVKLTNPTQQTIKMESRNYVRLSVNKNESEFLAPDIHNDPVEIQAISTKFTRIGFPVNTKDQDFVLQVGEITGEKQKVELSIKP